MNILSEWLISMHLFQLLIIQADKKWVKLNKIWMKLLTNLVYSIIHSSRHICNIYEDLTLGHKANLKNVKDPDSYKPVIQPQ